MPGSEASRQSPIAATLLPPAGVWKPATLPQCSEPGLKNGRKIIAVIGSMDSTPSTVANAAPSRIPR